MIAGSILSSSLLTTPPLSTIIHRLSLIPSPQDSAALLSLLSSSPINSSRFHAYPSQNQPRSQAQPYERCAPKSPQLEPAHSIPSHPAQPSATQDQLSSARKIARYKTMYWLFCSVHSPASRMGPRARRLPGVYGPITLHIFAMRCFGTASFRSPSLSLFSFLLRQPSTGGAATT